MRIDSIRAALNDVGYAVIPALAAADEYAELLSTLRSWHEQNVGEPIVETLEHAPACYNEPIWDPLAARVKELAGELLGENVIEVGRQLVGSQKRPISEKPQLSPHIESVGFATRQAADGGDPIFPRMQLLCGIYLNDLTNDQSGQLWVYPGSHRLALESLQGKESFRKRLSTFWKSVREKLPQPVALCAKAGDLLLLHPLLAHASGFNSTIEFSGRLYFRFAVEHLPYWTESNRENIISYRCAAERAVSKLTKEKEAILRSETSLYSMDESARGSPLLARYVHFKLGDVCTRNALLTELATLVVQKHSRPKNSERWYVATASTNDLAEDFALLLTNYWRLSNPIKALRVSTPATPSSDYTDCPLEERERIAQSFFEGPEHIDGDGVILIDDMITSGTALATLAKFLIQRGLPAGQIFPYAMVRSYFQSPDAERSIVDNAVSQLAAKDIAAILNHPDYYVTSGTMFRHLRGITPERRREILQHLRQPTVNKIFDHAEVYYGVRSLEGYEEQRYAP